MGRAVACKPGGATQPEPEALDWERYGRLLLHAAAEVLDILQPELTAQQFHLPLSLQGRGARPAAEHCSLPHA